MQEVQRRIIKPSRVENRLPCQWRASSERQGDRISCWGKVNRLCRIPGYVDRETGLQGGLMDWRTMLEAHVCARIWDAGPSGSEVTRPERPSAVGGGRPRPHQTLSLFFAHFRDESLGTCPAHKHIVKTLMVLEPELLPGLT